MAIAERKRNLPKPINITVKIHKEFNCSMSESKEFEKIIGEHYENSLKNATLKTYK